MSCAIVLFIIIYLLPFVLLHITRFAVIDCCRLIFSDTPLSPLDATLILRRPCFTLIPSSYFQVSMPHFDDARWWASDIIWLLRRIRHATPAFYLRFSPRLSPFHFIVILALVLRRLILIFFCYWRLPPLPYAAYFHYACCLIICCRHWFYLTFVLHIEFHLFHYAYLLTFLYLGLAISSHCFASGFHISYILFIFIIFLIVSYIIFIILIYYYFTLGQSCFCITFIWLIIFVISFIFFIELFSEITYFHFHLL